MPRHLQSMFFPHFFFKIIPQITNEISNLRRIQTNVELLRAGRGFGAGPAAHALGRRSKGEKGSFNFRCYNEFKTNFSFFWDTYFAFFSRNVVKTKHIKIRVNKCLAS